MRREFLDPLFGRLRGGKRLKTFKISIFMGKRQNNPWLIILVIIVLILVLIYLFPNLQYIINKKVEISWQSWDGKVCWNFDKTSNLMALDVLRDCNTACNSKYHLVSKDYLCNTETSKVNCICGNPA